MKEEIKVVREFYNTAVQSEWERIDGKPEFLITCRFLDRYVKPGDSVLDIGGGPGRYSKYLLDKGCDVTLLDLSEENVRFALEMSPKLKGFAGDARLADEMVQGPFDHVLLMGPLYHLPEEKDRVQAVNAALKLLKPGGTLFVSFISSHAGMIYLMKDAPEQLQANPTEEAFMELIIDDKPFAGVGFTTNYFVRQQDVLPFMAQFPLEKRHLFGQESILAPCENNILRQSPEVYAKWIDLAEKLSEMEKFLSWAEHLMYVGRKK